MNKLVKWVSFGRLAYIRDIYSQAYLEFHQTAQAVQHYSRKQLQKEWLPFIFSQCDSTLLSFLVER